MNKLTFICIYFTFSFRCDCRLPNYGWDFKGPVKVVSKYNSDSDTSIFYFNSSGNYDSLRYSHSIEKYYYDKNNHIVLITFGSVKEEFTYFRNLIVKKHYDEDTVLHSIIKYYFNSECRLDSDLMFNYPSMNLYNKYVYKYDDHNNPIEVSNSLFQTMANYFYVDNKITGKTIKYHDAFETEKYDSLGNIIEWEVFNNDTLTRESRFIYKYDSYGNWIQSEEIQSYKKTEYKEFTIRKIKYY